jgi:hypothetical protein
MVILPRTIGTIHKNKLLETGRLRKNKYHNMLYINVYTIVNAITNGNHCYPYKSNLIGKENEMSLI